MEEASCPFCLFRTHSEYEILYHLESVHPEGESPFVVKNSFDQLAQSEELQGYPGDEYTACPIDGCGEIVHLSELENHIDMHRAEDDESGVPSNQGELHPRRAMFNGVKSDEAHIVDVPDQRNGNEIESLSSRRETTKRKWKEILHMSNTTRDSQISEPSKDTHRRLGTSELGPHAHEKQMPGRLRKLLEADGQPKSINMLNMAGSIKTAETVGNHRSNILPVLSQLLQQDSYTEYAYTCHPCVKHITKLKNEGGFCGYRNIQMMASYIIGAESQGFHHFGGVIPTIFQIQDLIEHAWDIGINKQGRQETGGIRGTRKYIGTPEAQAMFCSLNIACNAQGLKSNDKVRADQLLLESVENYFAAGCSKLDEKLRWTTLPPIYFQHPGHSMTVIGCEKKRDGSMNLLVFDPMFHDSAKVTKLVGQHFSYKTPADLLRAYRRGTKYLRKYNEFELLRLTPPPASEPNIVK